MPLWAERPAHDAWHPRHIAERYGLFTIIVLGECDARRHGRRPARAGRRGDAGAGCSLVAAGGLLVVFALWWLYFDRARRTTC